MGDGGAHLRSAVLEDEDAVDVGTGPEVEGPLRPQVDDPARPRKVQGRERGVVVGGVEDHLTAGALHGRPAVLEPADLVRLRGLGSAGAEGAGPGGEGGSVLPALVDDDHGARERVDPQVGDARPSFAGHAGTTRSTASPIRVTGAELYRSARSLRTGPLGGAGGRRCGRPGEAPAGSGCGRRGSGLPRPAV